MTALFNLDFWVFVGVVAGIFTVFALGLQLQFGFTGLLNFGHAAFMAIGAYTMAILVVKVDMPLWLAMIVAIAAAVTFGLFIGLPTLRLRTDYLAIATIAFAEIVRFVALNESQLTGGPQGTINLLGAGRAASFIAAWRPVESGIREALEGILQTRLSHDMTMLIVVWSVALVVLVVLRFITRSPWGRVLRAIREDEDAAAALGKPVFRYKLQSLAIGAAVGALAGLLYAFQFSFFAPNDFAPLVTFFAYVIVILGGIGTYWGVPVGAVVFGVIFAGTRFLEIPVLSELSSGERAHVRLIVIGLILIGLMAFRPQGIFGKREEMILGR
ncbi:MAG: branched-chain amino acid ABC transporter permease [Candidatus Limnocylindria bacterium]